eukprot:TRINITY_DN10917_c0_g1_i1.p1 TRINITY_DN10917_c0_g1~~TRINITY_DN10917_c0_g1_i1.p1  ORF type:complete len:312 (-),score=118.89 TRINITY_DN10917_c0_g1_i1:62-997(-)
MAQTTKRVRIGIVGYGSLGQYMTEKILGHPDLELAFVWNRNLDKVHSDARIEKSKILENLTDIGKFNVDFIVEVAHPNISKQFGGLFLEHGNYFIGSPTCFADAEVEKELRDRSEKNNKGNGVYVPTGAFWGVKDILKMNKSGSLSALTVTMKKHPLSLKVEGRLVEKVEEVINKKIDNEEVVIYEGNVRELCPLAPNNVNTMAVAALAASRLGLDGVVGRLVVDSRLDAHIIEIEAFGPKPASPTTSTGKPSQPFSVKTTRYNPAAPGAVTGTATYLSFFNSLLEAATTRPKVVGGEKSFEFNGNGFHFC